MQGTISDAGSWSCLYPLYRNSCGDVCRQFTSSGVQRLRWTVPLVSPSCLFKLQQSRLFKQRITIILREVSPSPILLSGGFSQLTFSLGWQDVTWRLAEEDLEEENGQQEGCDDFGDSPQPRHTYLPF